METDHDLKWLANLFRYRLREMGPREKNVDLKFCRAGAKKLLENIDRDLEALDASPFRPDSADASDAYLAQPPAEDGIVEIYPEPS